MDIDLGRTVTVSDFVKKVKQTSSAWLKTQGREIAGFKWQTGCGVFSVGRSQLPALLK